MYFTKNVLRKNICYKNILVEAAIVIFQEVVITQQRIGTEEEKRESDAIKNGLDWVSLGLNWPIFNPPMSSLFIMNPYSTHNPCQPT